MNSPELGDSRPFSVATWNMDHWKRTVDQRQEAWAFLQSGLGADVALLQECVPPRETPSDRILYREIAGSRPWGSAVFAVPKSLLVEEVGPVRTRYGSTHFHLLGTVPGTMVVAQVEIPDVGPVTFVSVYGLIDVYSQTTMLRIVADLIPLFDSPAGERVILGGDFNVTTATTPDTPELQRYDAVLRAVESLGLENLAETAAEKPPQLENCLCGAEACHHLHTYGDHPGSQLDWLYATPGLARRCRTLRVERSVVGRLSDHAPVVADFDMPLGDPTRQWDPESFVAEVAVRHGTEAARVAEELVAWAQRKHQWFQRQGRSYAGLDRLPTSTGPDPELWLQLDMKNPEALGWTISLKADGRVVIQFQYMQAPPVDSEDVRRGIWTRINSLEGVSLEPKLTGRPTFPIHSLTHADNLDQFVAILDDMVEQMVERHEASAHRS